MQRKVVSHIVWHPCMETEPLRSRYHHETWQSTFQFGNWMSPTIPDTTSHHPTTLLHSYIHLDSWVWVSSLSLVLCPFVTVSALVLFSEVSWNHHLHRNAEPCLQVVYTLSLCQGWVTPQHILLLAPPISSSILHLKVSVSRHVRHVGFCSPPSIFCYWQLKFLLHFFSTGYRKWGYHEHLSLWNSSYSKLALDTSYKWDI